MNLLSLILAGAIVYGIGYIAYLLIVSDDHELTTKDTWMAFIWPIKCIIWFLMAVVNTVINDGIIPIFLLMFGFHYKDTKVYRIINKYTDV